MIKIKICSIRKKKEKVCKIMKSKFFWAYAF